MKTLLILLFTITTFAQTQMIELKPSGFESVADSTNYKVINFDNQSQNELYKSTLKYLTKIYRNPNNVISKVENESIAINAFTDEVKTDGDLYSYSLRYKINIDFKDGKLKFEPFILELYENYKYDSTPKRIYVSELDSPQADVINCIYMKSNKTNAWVLLHKDIKGGVDNWSNAYLNALIKGVKSQDKDW